MATVHTLSRLRDNRALHLGHLWLAYLEKQMHRIDKVKINIRRSRFFFITFILVRRSEEDSTNWRERNLGRVFVRERVNLAVSVPAPRSWRPAVKKLNLNSWKNCTFFVSAKLIFLLKDWNLISLRLESDLNYFKSKEANSYLFNWAMTLFRGALNARAMWENLYMFLTKNYWLNFKIHGSVRSSLLTNAIYLAS